MSSMIYPKLAFSNMKKSRRTYLPYLLTCIITVMLFYIMNSLAVNRGLNEMRRAGSLKMIMGWATVIVAIFAVIFLFYTNSFLVRQRKKEFGLYQVLGMDKRNLAKMMTWETVFTAAVSLAAGLLGGIMFGKLMFLLLLKLIHNGVPLAFAVEGKAIVNTLILFLCIFLASLLFNLLQIQTASPIQLLHGGRQGEKEPKAKWFIALIGLICLGIGYYIALTTEGPLQAITQFFIAVLLVIAGTYLLFTAGSIVLFKALRKNKKFYYNPRHFISVSGMIYRMKQNAVGLSNICILSTVVLVLVSTSFSTYAGMKDVMATRYPMEMSIQTLPGSTTADIEKINQIVREETEKYGVTLKDQSAYRYGSLVGVIEGSKITLEEQGSYDKSTVGVIMMIPLEDYNRMENDQAELSAGDVIVYDASGKSSSPAIDIQGTSYNVVKSLKELKLSKSNQDYVFQTIYLVFPDESVIENILHQYVSEEEGIRYNNAFNLSGSEDKKEKAMSAIKDRINGEAGSCIIEIREEERVPTYQIYGGFLFIGVFLGFMFLMATVLIIYYKQISEGMDDQERYQIMQKVGMSKKEIRKTINSQVLLVFFLPLIMAVIHIAAAFKVITELLAIMNLVNVTLFLICTIVTVVVFAVFYAIVFRVTAREYYKIVQ